MKRITREMCLVFLKDYYYSILVFHAISISITPAFEIHFHKDTSITASAIQRLAIQSCNIGDRFYLLICEDGRKKRIIQIFDKQHFNIQRREFQYNDEKYCVKTDLPD